MNEFYECSYFYAATGLCVWASLSAALAVCLGLSVALAVCRASLAPPLARSALREWQEAATRDHLPSPREPLQVKQSYDVSLLFGRLLPLIGAQAPVPIQRSHLPNVPDAQAVPLHRFSSRCAPPQIQLPVAAMPLLLPPFAFRVKQTCPLKRWRAWSLMRSRRMLAHRTWRPACCRAW